MKLDEKQIEELRQWAWEEGWEGSPTGPIHHPVRLEISTEPDLLPGKKPWAGRYFQRVVARVYLVEPSCIGPGHDDNLAICECEPLAVRRLQ
jgi:hypothetical protein